jgi:FkbM family methyltransferase
MNDMAEEAAAPAQPRVASVNNNLIFDIGMSEGNDTEFYLSKGFNVIGVEADPVVFEKVVQRFARHISDGTLTVLNRAAHSSSGRPLRFWRNEREQGHSSLNEHHSIGEKTSFEVVSINYEGLISMQGTPRYLKIDIEGGEQPFLDSLSGNTLPPYISAECHTFLPISTLFRLGYEGFKLVNQTLLNNVPLPNPALEGIYVEKAHWPHSSGPFGLESPGSRWLSFQEVASVFESVKRLQQFPEILHGWFDCHASLKDHAA